MSLLLIHNPDHYLTAQITRFWTSAHANAQVTASGYDSTNGLTASALGAYATRMVNPGDDQAFAIGGRFKVTSYPASKQILLAVVESTGTVQCSLVLNTDGTLSLYGGTASGTELLATGASLSLGAWHRLGLKGVVHQSNGSLEAHLNSTRAVENIIGRKNGVNTAAAGADSWSGIYVGLGSAIICGHFYAVDGGGVVTGLLPGLRVRVLRPLTVGTFDEWDKVGGTLPGVLDDMTPDDDSTIISTATFLDRYSVLMGTLAATEKIHGVQSEAQVRNIADSGFSPSHAPLSVVGGTEYDRPWQSCVTDAWRSIWSMWPVNPTTSLPWTVAEVNASEWGGKVQA